MRAGLQKKMPGWWLRRKCLVIWHIARVFVLVERGKWMVFCGEVVAFCMVIFAVLKISLF
ncbi:MAG: hypothetical protein WDN23_19415 [Edaphobacter sp.]